MGEETTTNVVEKTESPDANVDAVNLLAQGKRNMVCGEIPQAVNQLQEACRLLAGKFGETANECGEVYFLYGKALLDMARLESGVLGNALQGVPDEEEEETEDKDGAATSKSDDKEEKDESAEEDMDKIREQVFDAMGERDEEVAAREKKEKESEKEEKSEDKEKSDEKMEESADKEKGEKPEEKSEDKEKGEEKKEEITDKKEGEKEENQEKEEVSEEKKEVSEEKKESDAEAEKKDKDKEADKTEEKDAEGEEKMDTEGDEGEEGEEEEAEEETEAGEEGEDKTKKEEDDADDVPNLQLAWEMLELAKVIYSRQESKEMKLKTAETYLKLGEVGLETEQYEQAIGDFNECLKLQKEHLDAEDRLLAETYYQLGLAFSFNAQFDEAVENYKCATKVIESKLEKLNKFVEENESGKGKEAASSDDPLVNAQKEIKDLKEILPDIMAKIEDAEEEKKNRDQVKQMVKENVATDAGTTTVGFGESSSSSDKVESSSSSVSNITHLVRKKRKPEEEEENAETKKQRQDGENEAGDADSKKNGEEKVESTTNGTSESKGVNGDAVNGAVNGSGDHKAAEETPKEVVSKTVEDVLKKKEGEEQMETSNAVETS